MTTTAIISNGLALPESGPRREFKHWVLDNIEPTVYRTTAYVIRSVRSQQFLCNPREWGPMWALNVDSHNVLQFESPAAARKLFPRHQWLGNWIDCLLPRRWRRVIPYRLYEIVQVHNVITFCLERGDGVTCRHRDVFL